MKEFSQAMTFKIFKPMLGKFVMDLWANREPETQKINAQYPCVATNLG